MTVTKRDRWRRGGRERKRLHYLLILNKTVDKEDETGKRKLIKIQIFDRIFKIKIYVFRKGSKVK